MRWKKAAIFVGDLLWGVSEPKSRWQKGYRWCNRTLTVVGAVYISLLFNPQIAFSHSFTHRNYTIHSSTPLSDDCRAVLERADALLQQSDIFTRDAHHDIFLCNDSPAKFNTFFVRNGSWAYGFAHPTGNIFIANASPTHDLAWKTVNTNIVRSLSGLIAHEVTHTLVLDHVGFLGQRRLPKWINEGYAEYISMHDQKDYEFDICQDLPKSVRPFSIHPTYQAHLTRVELAFGDQPARFNHLLRPSNKKL